MRLSQFLIIFLAVVFFSCGEDNSGEFVASGIVEGTPVKVAAQTGGYILQINFDEGDEINRGQVIAVVDTEKLVYQMDQVQAALEEANIQYKINLNTLEKARADFENIRNKYARFQELYEKNSASKQQVDDLETALETARAQLQNAQQGLKVVESKKKGLEAQSKLLKRQIDDATIKSPISGTVTTQYYEDGETIPTGFAVAEIIDLSEMWTKIYISEKMLPAIKVGQQAEIRIDGAERTLAGRVSWISPKAEFTPKNILTEETRTSLVYAVKVEVDNPDGILKHGMPVEVAIRLQQL